MFPFFSYTRRPFSILILSLFLLSPPPISAADPPISAAGESVDTIPNNTWHTFTRFLDAAKGTKPEGMADLKRYFGRFGYLPPPENLNFTDTFDDEFEHALLLYQKNLGLIETGKLDFNTMKVIVTPRCGVYDLTQVGSGGDHGIKTTRRFAYFDGQPRWVRNPPMTLTYAFSPTYMIDYVELRDIKAAFARAFGRWSAAIPLKFTETADYSTADIRIGWYSGDHGDGEAFDGALGVLAHAFSPENGRFHLDAAERWSVDFKSEKSKVAIDLESVATHEIGHVLGLAHSSVKEAIMYPSLTPRSKKLNLRMDDVEGIQALYGSNPDFKYDSRLESDVSLANSDRRKGLLWSAAMALTLIACLFSIGL